MSNVILEGEIVRSLKSENNVKFDVKVNDSIFHCEAWGNMCKYNFKSTNKIRLVGRLEKRKFEGGNVCFVVAEHIEFR